MNRRRRKKLDKAVGEISNLRDYQPESFNTSINLRYHNPNYILDSSKVDYKLAKELYYNSHGNYKLGAGFCKPIINIAAGFIGTPSVESKDDNAQAAIDKYITPNTHVFSEVPKKMMRDGDTYLMVTKRNTENNPLYTDNEVLIDFNLLPPECVKVLTSPVDKNKIIRAAIITSINYRDEQDNNVKYDILEVWTDTEHSITYDNKDAPQYILDMLMNVNEINPYGFIPIIKIKNETEELESNGRSDLEPVEPYVRAYHDVMLDLLKSSKLTASPKMKIKAEDYAQFLQNNFTQEEINSRQLSLSGKNIIILGKEDDGGYMEVSAATHTVLLEFLFMCIVDVSETPEFAFGTAVASSKASVSEQITPLLKKVERKRAYLNHIYKMLARMVFAISNMNVNSIDKITDFDTGIVWEEIDSTDDSTVANTIKTLIDGFVTAIDNKLIAPESAINFLSRFVDTMSLFEETEGKGEKDKILKQLDEFTNKTSESDKKEIENIKKMLESTTGGNNPENNTNGNTENNTNNLSGGNNV